jgi:hypothetical protein
MEFYLLYFHIFDITDTKSISLYSDCLPVVTTNYSPFVLIPTKSKDEDVAAMLVPLINETIKKSFD